MSLRSPDNASLTLQYALYTYAAYNSFLDGLYDRKIRGAYFAGFDESWA